MKKVISINGMSCAHCQAAVEKELNKINGVSAKVNLKKNQAVVNITTDVSDDILKNAVTEAGFEPVSVEEKKGLFS